MDIEGLNEVVDPDSYAETELLGSVTHTQDCEGAGIQLRSSARVVSKKLRLDSLALTPPVLQQVVAPDKKDNVKEVEEKPKGRRTPELWSTEDKNDFFEALNEYGKDFDAIQNHLMVKAKRRGEVAAKNKDQARHFYYRTWLKISKHLKFPDDVKKSTQELYALINFGEIRKKIGFLKEKYSVKLNELIYSGATQIRFRGKTWRIKTPVCRALRKLNLIDDNSEELKLPSRICVELLPRDNEAWCRVQAAAQNPQVRAVLPLQRRLSTLLQYLQLRWRPHSDKLREKVGVCSEEGGRGCGMLRVGPQPAAHISQPSVKLSEMVTSSRLSLHSHELRYGTAADTVASLLRQLQISQSAKGKGGAKRQRCESYSEKGNVRPCEGLEQEPVDGRRNLMGDTVDSAINQLISLHSGLGGEEQCSGMVSKKSNEKKNQSDFAAKVQSGWTMENVGGTRMGELYLMFGSESKVTLEYWWEPEERKEDDTQMAEELSSAATPFSVMLPLLQEMGPPSSSPLSETLQKLLSIAKIHYRKAKVHCPCGHSCGTNTRPNASSRVRTAVSRTLPKQMSLEITPEITVLPTATVLPTHYSADGVFRRPLLAPSLVKPSPQQGIAEAFRAQLDKFRPRYSNRRGRTGRPKNVVVQRTLPLLPKVPVVTRRVVQQREGRFTPIAPASPPASSGPCLHVAELVADQTMPENNYVTLTIAPLTPATNLTEVPSPKADECAQPCAGVSQSFVGLLDKSSILQVQATPPTSPTRILNENESQWLNSEVADFSLSSFLGHLESPMKNCIAAGGAPVSDDTRMSSDVEAQLQCLMSENSVDYMAKFADLAAQIAADSPNGK